MVTRITNNISPIDFCTNNEQIFLPTNLQQHRHTQISKKKKCATAEDEGVVIKIFDDDFNVFIFCFFFHLIFFTAIFFPLHEKK